jgi:hypothetical protein
MGFDGVHASRRVWPFGYPVTPLAQVRCGNVKVSLAGLAGKKRSVKLLQNRQEAFKTA